jgi:hypothetical protein
MLVPVTDIPPPSPAIPFGVKDQHEIGEFVPNGADTSPRQIVELLRGVIVLLG